MGLRPPVRTEQPPGDILREAPGSLQTRCRGQDLTLTPHPFCFSAGEVPLTGGALQDSLMTTTPAMPLDSAAACFLAKLTLLGCRMKSQKARDGPPAFHQDIPVLPGRSELV